MAQHEGLPGVIAAELGAGVEHQPDGAPVAGERRHRPAFVAGVADGPGLGVAVFVGIGAGVGDGPPEGHTRRFFRIIRVVGKSPVEETGAFRVHQFVLLRVVARKLHGRVVAADFPGKAVVLALANPVHFFGVVAVAGVFHAEQIARGREGDVEGVAHAPRKHVTAGLQLGFVVGQKQVVGRGGNPVNLGGQRLFAQTRIAALVVLHLAVVGARSACDVEGLPVGRKAHAAEGVVVEGFRRRVVVGAHHVRPGPGAVVLALAAFHQPIPHHAGLDDPVAHQVHHALPHRQALEVVDLVLAGVGDGLVADGAVFGNYLKQAAVETDRVKHPAGGVVGDAHLQIGVGDPVKGSDGKARAQGRGRGLGRSSPAGENKQDVEKCRAVFHGF